MDRDKRWERVKVAVDALTQGTTGEGGDAVDTSEDVFKVVEERYKRDETDEFLKPIVVGGEDGRIKGAWFRLAR